MSEGDEGGHRESPLIYDGGLIFGDGGQWFEVTRPPCTCPPRPRRRWTLVTVYVAGNCPVCGGDWTGDDQEEKAPGTFREALREVLGVLKWRRDGRSEA